MSRIALLTPYQKRFIKKNRLKMSANDMALKWGYSRGVVGKYMTKNGLTAPFDVQQKFKIEKLLGRTSSTPEIDRYLIKSYQTIPLITMAKNVNRTNCFIRTRLRQLELVRPQEMINQFVQNSQYKNGNVPMNKGRKMIEYMDPEAIANCLKTAFQPGRKTEGELYDGAITTRKTRPTKGGNANKYIRVEKNIWKPLQVHNWEKEIGPIPQGLILACKTDNVLDCRTSNWELVSRAEIMIRNSASSSLADRWIAYMIATKNNTELIPEILKNKDLIELKRQQLILKRTINETTGNSKNP